MSTPIPLKLRSGDYCISSIVDGGGSTIEAWTTRDLSEALHVPDFLAPMQNNCGVGDHIELLRLARWTDLDTPERDPLEMASLTVTHFDLDRDGKHMRFAASMPRLRFGPAKGKGIEVGRWGGQYRVYRDGERVASFPTRIEAVERAEFVRDPKGAQERANAILSKPLELPSTASLPASHRANHEDVSIVIRKVSRLLTVRTLDPIADVLADRFYFTKCASRFRTGDRVTFLRYTSDTHSELAEFLTLALADLDAGRVVFHPQTPIATTKFAPEAGAVAQKVGDRWTLRVDGKTVERFPSEQQLEWPLQHKGIGAEKKKAA